MKEEPTGVITQGTTRREFLRSSGIAIAGAALVPGILTATQSGAQAAVASAATKKIRMGIVGGGFGAAFHWHLDPDCIVEAVSDLREDRRKHLMNVYKCNKSYNSLEEMILDKNIDAVAVFSGPPDHVKHATACMEAGKHVISAVPACTTLEQGEELLAVQKRTGMTYMMAETSMYHPIMLSAQEAYKKGEFGNIYYTEAEYHHNHDAAAIQGMWFGPNGERTWRWAFPPMLYPTHATSFLVGLTGEHFTEVACIGWGDDDPAIKGNPYNNPFWNETALFKTNKGNACRISVNWKGAFGSCERGQWYGTKMSMFEGTANGLGPVIRRFGGGAGVDGANYAQGKAEFEEYKAPDWPSIKLPAAMRVGGGHAGAEPMITHEFISALKEGRKPAVDIHLALAATIPGIVAHKSALKGGVQMKCPTWYL